jgi:hypothetical protein
MQSLCNQPLRKKVDQACPFTVVSEHSMWLVVPEHIPPKEGAPR